VLFSYSPGTDIKVVNKTKQTEKDLAAPELHLELGPKGNVQISYCSIRKKIWKSSS